MKASSLRVQTYLEQTGRSFNVVQMPASTRTAADAAKAIGCTVSQIAKSLVFRDEKSGDAVLVVASGTIRVSVKKIDQATGLALGIFLPCSEIC